MPKTEAQKHSQNGSLKAPSQEKKVPKTEAFLRFSMSFHIEIYYNLATHNTIPKFPTVVPVQLQCFLASGNGRDSDAGTAAGTMS